MKKFRLTLVLLCASISLFAQDYVSQVWVPDQGDGTYRNPILDADYSDPDLCRAGEDYYMTASSFNCIPGLPILHSRDLVNWRIINHALPRISYDGAFDQPQHGNGVWAPSIRYHEGTFYIFYGDPDRGIFMLRTQDPAGRWSAPVNVKPGKGMIDPCPLWDGDRVYLVHGYAGSRAGMKSVLGVCELNADASAAITESRLVFDGHPDHPTVEGPKFYKKDGYYYIFAPAGGVPTGWQLVMRSKDVYGPYEARIVMAQGSTSINGPHQGGWVTTPDGKEDWFMHFQDKYVYGRVVHLQPMQWKEGWPVIGIDREGKGCGEPVLSYRKPSVGKTYPICTPAESDEFESRTLGLQWQWHSNYSPLWYYTASERSRLRLFSVQEPAGYRNLFDVGNLLLQKTPTDRFTATMKVEFTPLPAETQKFGERTGLLVMGRDYALLSLENTPEGFILTQRVCMNAEKGTQEKINASTALASLNPGVPLYLRVEVSDGAQCQFSYSTDNRRFTPLGVTFTAREGKWIGAKIGTFVTRPFASNDSGWADVDWFRITKK